MKVIGLTGPSGAGKGLCGEFFRSLGIPCLDADEIYHGLLIPPSDCVNALQNRFGDSIIKEDGTVDRKALGQIVFSDNSGKNLKDLNRITHGFVENKIVASIDNLRLEKKHAVVIDAPLLFESGLDKKCDFTVCVLADRNIRIQRIMERDSISKNDAELRINAQKTDDFYIKSGKYHIINNDDADYVYQQITKILASENIIL